MKKYKKLFIGSCLVLIAIIIHLGVRPSITVSYNGSYLDNSEILVIRGGATETINLDEDGSAYLKYRDIGKIVIITPLFENSSESKLEGAVKKITMNNNKVVLTQKQQSNLSK